jgi:hypothetical protein
VTLEPPPGTAGVLGELLELGEEGDQRVDRRGAADLPRGQNRGLGDRDFLLLESPVEGGERGIVVQLAQALVQSGQDGGVLEVRAHGRDEDVRGLLLQFGESGNPPGGGDADRRAVGDQQGGEALQGLGVVESSFTAVTRSASDGDLMAVLKASIASSTALSSWPPHAAARPNTKTAVIIG